MEIRALGKGDLPQLTELFDQYRVFYERPSDRAAVKAFLRQRLTREDSAFIGAIVHDVLIGFTQLYPSYTSVGLARLWILNDLYVSADARRRGVGAALMHAAQEYAEMTGAKAMVLSTAVDNHTAQQLYEKLGWVREKDFYQYELSLAQS
ncbi:MAG: GNAT family N-acetyltransferase [Gammaproteobacteria bacterium]|nr:GNAT family N-acetyltransferase [Gammaproteobacteria bacterium]MDH3767452.1 GNAT family N-acetyltransferase [Gammaproteobacteria bacterium]